MDKVLGEDLLDGGLQISFLIDTNGKSNTRDNDIFTSL